MLAVQNHGAHKRISFTQCSIDESPLRNGDEMDRQTRCQECATVVSSVESPVEDKRGNVHTTLFLVMTLAMLFAQIWL